MTTPLSPMSKDTRALGKAFLLSLFLVTMAAALPQIFLGTFH